MFPARPSFPVSRGGDNRSRVPRAKLWKDILKAMWRGYIYKVNYAWAHMQRHALPHLLACVGVLIACKVYLFVTKKKPRGFNILQVKECSDYRTVRGYVSIPVLRLWRQTIFVQDVQTETTQIRQHSSVTSSRRNQMQQQTESASVCSGQTTATTGENAIKTVWYIYFFCDTKTHNWQDWRC